MFFTSNLFIDEMLLPNLPTYCVTTILVYYLFICFFIQLLWFSLDCFPYLTKIVCFTFENYCYAKTCSFLLEYDIILKFKHKSHSA